MLEKHGGFFQFSLLITAFVQNTFFWVVRQYGNVGGTTISKEHATSIFRGKIMG